MSSNINILLIAGTMESVKLIECFQQNGCKVLTLNTSRQIFDALMKIKGLRMLSGASSVGDFERIIVNSKIDIIIDESKPFSFVSTVLTEAAKQRGIVYCKYETQLQGMKTDNIIFAKDNAHCVEILNKHNGNILLTIGTYELEDYLDVRDYESRLYVKVLPSIAAIEKCEKLGIPSSNIMALQGAVSKEFIVALINHVNASVLVSKDFGKEGRIERKIDAAEECGIPIVLIKKLEVVYSNKFKTTDEVLAFINEMSEGVK